MGYVTMRNAVGLLAQKDSASALTAVRTKFALNCYNTFLIGVFWQIIGDYTCDLGVEFPQSAFHYVLAEIWDYWLLWGRPAAGQDYVEANRQRLEGLATRVFESARLFLYQIAKIFRAMEVKMTRLGMEVETLQNECVFCGFVCKGCRSIWAQDNVFSLD